MNIFSKKLVKSEELENELSDHDKYIVRLTDIPKATIIEFASKGCNVVINYNKDEKRAKELQEYILSTYQVKALCLKADVSNYEL